MKESKIFLDYDDMDFYQVFKDVLHLQREFNLSEADIFESSESYLYDCTFWDCGIVRFGSWHVKFPKDVRKWKEAEDVLDFSNAHEGFKHFSKSVQDITLRISEKRGSKAPELICTVDEEGGVEYA